MLRLIKRGCVCRRVTDCSFHKQSRPLVQYQEISDNEVKVDFMVDSGTVHDEAWTSRGGACDRRPCGSRMNPTSARVKRGALTMYELTGFTGSCFEFRLIKTLELHFDHLISPTTSPSRQHHHISSTSSASIDLVISLSSLNRASLPGKWSVFCFSACGRQRGIGSGKRQWQEL
jgi:hypothetical protein